MMSRHFALKSELSGAIAQRLSHAKNQLSVPGSFFNQFVTDIIYTVEPAITATLYNGHLSISVTNEQSRPKFHNIEPVYSGHLLNAVSGHPFVVPY